MILLVNKIDRARPRERLLPFIADVSAKAGFAEVLLVSALKHDGIDRLPGLIAKYLPESPLLYPPGQLTDVSERFMAAEIIREKLTLRLQDELPYGLSVEIENMGPLEDEPGKLLVQAVMWVERTGQKAIVIGKGGERLKEIGRLARLELKDHFGQPVHLELWVKVKEDWSDSEAALQELRVRHVSGSAQTHPARAGLPAASLPVAGFEPHPRAADALARPAERLRARRTA